MPAPSESYENTVADVYPSIAAENFKGVYSGRVVFITGGGSGLGLASAKAYAQSGAKVFIVGRRIPVLEEAKAEIEKLGAEVGIAQVDVLQQDSIVKGVKAAVDRFGKIDVVIANAGGWVETGSSVKDTNADDWWGSVEINLKTAFLTAHATIPELIKTGNAHIVFMSTSFAQIRGEGQSAYNISKHALNRFAEYLDQENRAAGVKAFALHPGLIETDLSRRFAHQYGFDASKALADTPELNAWTQVRLTSGREDWLSGRYFAAPWGFDQIEPLKEKIVSDDALKNRLVLA